MPTCKSRDAIREQTKQLGERSLAPKLPGDCLIAVESKKEKWIPQLLKSLEQEVGTSVHSKENKMKTKDLCVHNHLHVFMLSKFSLLKA